MLESIYTMDGSDKYKVLQYAEQHPHILLAVVIVLIIIVILMFLGSKGYISRMTGGRRLKKSTLEDDTEFDDLIDSIHDKQKKPAGGN